MKKAMCPECGSGRIINFNLQGEVGCKSCGLILDDSPVEKTPYSNKNYASHPHLATAGTNNYEGKIFKRSWLFTTKEKNIKKGLSRINWIASKLKLPDYATKEAKMIFKTTIEKDMTVGRGNVAMAYACVYASCIVSGIPKTPLEVIAYTSVSKTQMLRLYRILKKSLRINCKPINPLDFIPRFSYRLELKNKTITKANEIMHSLEKTMLLQGKHPQTIAASCIYLATKLNDEFRTQRQIANASGVIEVTIRKRSKEIADALEIIF